VVAAVDEEAAGVQQLVREDNQRDLDSLVAAVDEVAVDEVGVGGAGRALLLEDEQ